VSQSFSYQIRVQDKSTGQTIERARVTINVRDQAPLDKLTDSNGLARLFIDTTHADQPGELRIEANGFKTYIQNIDIVAGSLPDDVQLEPIISFLAATPTTQPEHTAKPATSDIDWESIVRIQELWTTCPGPRVAPNYIGLEQNLAAALNQIEDAANTGEYERWPLAPIMEFSDTQKGFIVMLRITSLLPEGSEQVDIGSPILTSVLLMRDAPETINIIAAGQCGAAGTIRHFSPVALSASDHKIATSSDAPFFYLKPKETEVFQFTFPCQSPGMYNIKLEIPYTFVDKSGSIIVESPTELVCPKSVSYWRFIDYTGAIPPEITTYTWDGTSYQKTS
jgi:hypothetical protein